MNIRTKIWWAISVVRQLVGCYMHLFDHNPITPSVHTNEVAGWRTYYERAMYSWVSRSAIVKHESAECGTTPTLELIPVISVKSPSLS